MKNIILIGMPGAGGELLCQRIVGIQEVKSMMEFVEKSFPDLVKEVTRLIPLQK